VQLYEKYSETKGLRILAFPCNQFGNQEPGTNQEIKAFAQGKFGVKFDMFSKIDVNGDSAHPLWKYMKAKQGGFMVDAIKWNFTKFLIDKNGVPVVRYATTTNPMAMEADLLKYFEMEADPDVVTTPIASPDSGNNVTQSSECSNMCTIS
jgi:phospholipid-hydroperoxide glutathione peroxidase